MKHNNGSRKRFAAKEKAANTPASSERRSEQVDSRTKLVVAGGLASLFLWAYWPTIVGMVGIWNTEPDYSHGFLVPPLAIYFLWVRREKFPGISPHVHWAGLGLIGLSIGVRWLGASLFLSPVDGWSMLFWIAGAVWLLGGLRLLAWTGPSVAFLWFMMPLPFQAEGMLSGPLQRIATKVSCWALQLLGQPALAEGNTILLGEHHLEVEQACSGLRIFISIVALAFVFVIVVRQRWWIKLAILASTIPIAVFANATRIVVTAILWQHVSGEFAHKFTHDFAGWFMIPYAFGLFALVIWYLGVLVREVQQVEIGSIVQPRQDATSVL